MLKKKILPMIDKQRLRVELFQLALGTETVIPLLTYFINLLLPFKTETQIEHLLTELKSFKELLLFERKHIDSLLQKVDMPRTGQVWWPGKQEEFYTKILTHYIDSIMGIVEKKNISINTEALPEILKNFSDKDRFFKDNELPEGEKLHKWKKRKA
jgi:hypothetical protein